MKKKTEEMNEELKQCSCEDCNCEECEYENGECNCEDCNCNECENNEESGLTKLNEAYNKISELEDKLIRQNADMVNFRRRKEEEINKMLKFCNEDIIKDLLPVLDNFERAINDTDVDEKTEQYLKGFKMIYCSIQNIMEKNEVKPIDGSNKPFDPVYHNAIMLEKNENYETGMVIEVLQKGYLYKDKVIRPAMVKVSE